MWISNPTNLCALQDHTSTCSFLSVKCPNGCGQLVKRSHMAEHQKHHCPSRLVPCAKCSELVKMDMLHDHKTVCLMESVSCLIGCHAKILRGEVNTYSFQVILSGFGCAMNLWEMFFFFLFSLMWTVYSRSVKAFKASSAVIFLSALIGKSNHNEERCPIFFSTRRDYPFVCHPGRMLKLTSSFLLAFMSCW